MAVAGYLGDVDVRTHLSRIDFEARQYEARLRQRAGRGVEGHQAVVGDAADLGEGAGRLRIELGLPAKAHAAGQDVDPAEAMVVRVAEYMIDNRAGGGELFCLITTLVDHEFATAVELAAAYAQRWEIELSFDEIEIHQTGGDRVLRSRTPELVKQEIWSLLLTHYAIRHVMKDAADTVGTDPDDLSFIRSYRAIRRQVPNQAGFSP